MIHKDINIFLIIILTYSYANMSITSQDILYLSVINKNDNISRFNNK